jgi:hypothetical protein
MHCDNFSAEEPGLCPVLSSGNMPSRQAGSFAETAYWAVSIRSALYIAGPLGFIAVKSTDYLSFREYYMTHKFLLLIGPSLSTNFLVA